MIEKDVALAYLGAGLSVLPASRTYKCPQGKWKQYQERLPTYNEVESWFSGNHDAMCIVCGKVSGNLEVMDFDNHGELFEKWKAEIPAELFGKLVVEQTQSGGYHVAYRCDEFICGNVKLAQGIRNDKTATLIETRGKGGLILCSPTAGYTLVQGEFTNLPRITEAERFILLNAAWQMNEVKHNSTPAANDMPQGFAMYEPNPSSFEQRPGDDFNARGDIRGLLFAYHWKSLGIQPDGNEYWQRPGKEDDGNSATLKNGIFYVFSTNAAPFQANRGYAPFTVYALLEHNGDFGKAAAKLLSCGYGKEADNSSADLEQFLKNISTAEKNIYTAREMLQEFTQMKEPLIADILRREEVMNIVAAPKTGKSWLVMQLALSLVTGRSWFGHPCTKCNVMMIDNELHKETLACRMACVAKAMGIDPEDSCLDNLIIFPQRGMIRDIVTLKAKLDELKERNPDIIIIDALYKALPKDTDENSNGQITAVYNLLDSYAREMKSAIILVHHTSKGNQANKNVTDIGSGAGAQSRSPDVHMALRPHNTEGVIAVSCCSRSFPSVKPFCIRRDENNLWIPAPDCDPDNLAGKDMLSGRKNSKRSYTVQEITDLFLSNLDTIELPMSKTALVEKIRDYTGCSKDKAESAIEQLYRQNILEIHSGDRAKNQQAMKCFYHGEESPYYDPEILPEHRSRAKKI